MRIAFVTPGFSADDADWCIPVLKDLAGALDARHDVTVYATCYPHAERRYSVEGVSVTSFGDGRPGRLAWLRRQIKAVRAILGAHERNPFDVLHGFWADGGGFVGARVNASTRLPFVVSVMAGELSHVPEVSYGKQRRPIAGRLARYGAREAATLVANSAWQARRIRQDLPALDPAVLRLGIDPARFSTDGDAVTLAGGTPILCCASLVAVKGHETLFGALAIALQAVPELYLHVVGDGALESALREHVDRRTLGHAVTFHGHVPHEQLPAYYRGARFCVSASWFESHGMVIVEAAACGTPTLGTDVGSLSDICLPELLTRPGDVEGLADAIVRMARDSTLRENAAAAALSSALRNYRLDQSVAALEGLYAQAIAKVAGSR